MGWDDIKACLGRPYFESDNAMIYNMDCLQGMRLLGDTVIDLTVTSPPYNIGKEYESLKPVAEYLAWCERWMQEVHRLTVATGAFWLNLGYFEMLGKAKAVPIAYLLWDKSPFYLQQEIVWHYGAGVSARRTFSPRNEKFLWYVKSAEDYTFNLDAVRDPNVKYPNQKKNGKLKCNPLGKNPSDVWEFPKVTSGESRSSQERTAHPAQFPIAVIDRIVKACSNSGDIVFDPFMGSGSTAVAALQNGRRVLGFEISATYCDIAAKRIRAALTEQMAQRAQLQLFA